MQMNKEQNADANNIKPHDGKPLVSGSFIQDDMVFIPYMGGSNGWQCKMNIAVGLISVRFGGWGLITDAAHPYEVWYPTEDAPTPYQTADDIWAYVRQNCH